jgi:hypothetical protein
MGAHEACLGFLSIMLGLSSALWRQRRARVVPLPPPL